MVICTWKHRICWSNVVSTLKIDPITQGQIVIASETASCQGLRGIIHMILATSLAWLQSLKRLPLYLRIELGTRVIAQWDAWTGRHYRSTRIAIKRSAKYTCDSCMSCHGDDQRRKHKKRAAACNHNCRLEPLPRYCINMIWRALRPQSNHLTAMHKKQLLNRAPRFTYKELRRRQIFRDLLTFSQPAAIVERMSLTSRNCERNDIVLPLPSVLWPDHAVLLCIPLPKYCIVRSILARCDYEPSIVHSIAIVFETPHQINVSINPWSIYPALPLRCGLLIERMYVRP